MRQSNFFIKHLISINKSINSLLEKNLNKLNSNNLINIARSNKIFLTIVALIILSLSYLSLPNIFKPAEISNEIKNELQKKFNLDLEFSQNLKYNFFPRPHFISNESSVFLDGSKISDIKNIKIYVSLKNLFSLENIKIINIVLDEASFNFDKQNYNFFTELLDNNFENSNLEIRNSKIFFRNIEKEVLFINKVIKMKYFYDPKELKNLVYSESEIFNIPYNLKIFDNKNEKILFSKFNLDFINLQIKNEHNYKDNIKIGSGNLIFNKLKSIFNYKLHQDLFEFYFFENSKFDYKIRVNFKPFYSNVSGDLDKLNLSYLFNSSSIIVQLLKTEIFNNKNINFGLNLNANKILNYNDFKNIILNSKIEEGLIDIDNTIFEWNDYANFKLFDTLIYVKEGELILDASSKIDNNKINKVYQFLLTPKNLRNKIKKVNLNFTYNFDKKVVSFEDIKIDGKFDMNVNKLMKNISISNNNLQNKIYFKNLLNEVIKVYAG